MGNTQLWPKIQDSEKKKNDAKVRIIVTADGVKVIRPEEKKEEPASPAPAAGSGLGTTGN